MYLGLGNGTVGAGIPRELIVGKFTQGVPPEERAQAREQRLLAMATEKYPGVPVEQALEQFKTLRLATSATTEVTKEWWPVLAAFAGGFLLLSLIPAKRRRRRR